MHVLEMATDIPARRLVAFQVQMIILCMVGYDAANLPVLKDEI
jgi:hypothetical protein